jgi:multimeric flavodoxin WrbA
VKRILLVNGSPRGKAATSFRFLEGIAERIPPDKNSVETVTVPARAGKKVPPGMLEAFYRCDVAVVAFPLYAYSIPAALTRFFEEYAGSYGAEAGSSGGPRLYAIVNSGYYDPEVNREALRVMRHFSRRHGFSYRFGAAFGGGLVTAMLENVPLVNRRLLEVYRAFIDDLISDDQPCPGEDLFIKPFIPKRVMLFMKDSNFSKRMMAKKLKG